MRKVFSVKFAVLIFPSRILFDIIIWPQRQLPHFFHLSFQEVPPTFIEQTLKALPMAFAW